MKILGKWWAGKILTCAQCGERFELDDTDKPIYHNTERLVIACPSCGRQVEAQRAWL